MILLTFFLGTLTFLIKVAFATIGALLGAAAFTFLAIAVLMVAFGVASGRNL